MRRLVLATLAAAALLLGAAAPASADSLHDGWVPAPSAPWDLPAGVRCDFAVHGEPIVDEVRKKVLATNADGSPKTEVYVGDLVIRVTNVETGAWFDADASGQAVIDYRADGSMVWYVHGPVLVGVAENGGNLPRGLYIIDGLYTLEISPTGYKTVTMAYGTTDSICAHID